MLLSVLIVLAVFYTLPLLACEVAIRKMVSADQRPAIDWLRAITFLAMTVGSGLWLAYILIIEGRHDFSHTQVVLAVLTAVVVGACLSLWGRRQQLPDRAIMMVVSVYSSFAMGVVFATFAAPTDSTGLWGVGLFILGMVSLLGGLLVSSVVLGVKRIL